ncbi:sensor histidine kinase [Synechocystis sp. LEGE 06083]|uniref:sensor histidine kinase n=1 Tax=Synechocystis sp. LEGE 06083 TaxID=915336 RepID=UPI0034CEB94D
MFALVMSGFAIAVRVVFVRNLKQQITDRLTVLGQGAAANAELDHGQLQVEDNFLIQDSINQSQTLEWFDRQKKLVKQQGNHSPQAPLNPQATVEIQAQTPPMQSITLPILSHETDEIIGYVRVSQLLDEFNETIFQLDIGLGMGVIIGIILSTAGSIWLNQQAMHPIETSFQRLRQFTADASHELRSPLMAISSNVEVALKYPDGMRTEDYEVITAIASATEQMTRLTEDLLLLARTDRATLVLLAPVNLSQLLNQLVQVYQSQAQNKQIALETILEPSLILNGDVSGLTRAFTNLLQNALRYTPSGGKVKVEALSLSHQIQVTVSDTGLGIAPEHLERIFERFWQADQARRYDDSGSGLGLSISQAIVQSHKGSIEVKSQPGEGSCFTVKLPLKSS